DLYIDLELGERRSRTDAVRVDAAGHDPGDVDERLGVRKAVAEQRHELGPAGERPRAVAERGGGFVGARRPQELHGALFRVPGLAERALRPHAGTASPLFSAASRSARSISSRVIGSDLMSAPVASRIALAIAAATGMIGGSPRPFEPR